MSKVTGPAYICSFCRKDQGKVRRLISGPGAVYICDDCAELCVEVLEEEGVSPKPARLVQGEELSMDRQILREVVGEQMSVMHATIRARAVARLLYSLESEHRAQFNLDYACDLLVELAEHALRTRETLRRARSRKRKEAQIE